MTGIMKAISVRQPWAWLIVNGYKDIENRTRNTSYRGRILIHASKKFDAEGYFWVKENFPEIKLPFWNSWTDDYKRGGVIGSIEIIASVKSNTSRWFTGPVGYVLRAPAEIPFTRCCGQLGIFTPKFILPKQKTGK